jgi:hypothetical protein
VWNSDPQEIILSRATRLTNIELGWPRDPVTDMWLGA